MKDFITTIVVAIFTSGALFSFIQFIMQRRDNKKNIKVELETKIDTGFAEIKNEVKEIKSDVKEVSDRLEEHKALQARIHILRFADELRAGMVHSEEYFKQQILDIDTYSSYCETHPAFANGLTVMASEYIREEYKRMYLSRPSDDDKSNDKL